MIHSPKNLKEAIKQHQTLIIVIVSVIILVMLFWLLSYPDTVPLPHSQKLEKPHVDGVQKAVDPRAIWSETIREEIGRLNSKLENAIQEQQQLYKNSIATLEQKIDSMHSLAQIEEPVPSIRIIEQPEPNKKQSNFVHLHQSFDTFFKKDTTDYVTSGSFARAVLLTGIVAETGTEAAGTPQPILLRLVDHGIFSKGYRTEQIKEAILIGACHGNISSERAVCRLETVSLMNRHECIIEKAVEGWLIGEDGRPGIRGDVIDKSSDVARMAILNGILGGIAGFFQNQATSSVYPISPITGQQKALTGIDSLRAGSASGVGNALQKLADYAIKRAEQMSPVIIVDAGRTIDVVFKRGFQLKDEDKTQSVPSVTSISHADVSQLSLRDREKETIYKEYTKDYISSLQSLQASDEGKW